MIDTGNDGPMQAFCFKWVLLCCLCFLVLFCGACRLGGGAKNWGSPQPAAKTKIILILFWNFKATI
jgi:hypothetical protein